MLGTLTNTAAILAGGILGLFIRKGIPDKISDAVMKGVALCVIYVGISGMLKGENPLIAILSMSIGGIAATLLDLDAQVNRLGAALQRKFQRDADAKPIGEGFVTASLLFCVGAMAIVGSLQSGLSGDHGTLFTKSMLDGISAIILASSLGAGVLFSAGAVLIYQGAITFLAKWISPVLGDAAIAEMTCVGSLLIIAMGLNMLGVTKIKVMNYLPAIFLPILFCLFM